MTRRIGGSAGSPNGSVQRSTPFASISRSARWLLLRGPFLPRSFAAKRTLRGMGHGRPLLLAGILCCTALLACAGSAVAASPKIISPSRNALIAGASVVVKVGASSSPHGTINGRDVSRLFARSGNLWRAGIGLQDGLRAGRNTVSVTTGGGTDAVSFALGRRTERLVAIDGVPRHAR